MAVGLDHPVVADYLRRLDAAAEGLAPGRRAELVAEIRGHIAEALESAGRDDEATVRGILDRLGDPEEIATAELDAESGAPTRGLGAVPTGGGPSSSAPPAYWSPGQPVGYPGQRDGAWGPVEIIAVLGLTVGTFVVPGVGPIVGLVCAWISDRWTRREKIVATIWTLGVFVAMLVLGVALFSVRASSPSGSAP